MAFRPRQLETIRMLERFGGKLSWWKWGAWTIPQVTRPPAGPPDSADPLKWYVHTCTVQSLERRGMVRIEAVWTGRGRIGAMSPRERAVWTRLKRRGKLVKDPTVKWTYAFWNVEGADPLEGIDSQTVVRWADKGCVKIQAVTPKQKTVSA